MSVLAKKLLGIGAALVVLAALIVLYVASWATSFPAPVAATGAAPVANLTLQTVGAIGPTYSPRHPDWVSYLVQQKGRWVHTAIFTVPAHSVVHVTVYQYDSQTGLRNAFLAQAQGTIGGTINVDGKNVQAVDPSTPAHTFAVPQLGVFVPVPGIPDSAKNPCAFAPCSLSNDHVTITFSFRTGAKGRYRWQCFVPCAAGFYLGTGGPMQTFGYMDGYLDVV